MIFLSVFFKHSTRNTVIETTEIQKENCPQTHPRLEQCFHLSSLASHCPHANLLSQMYDSILHKTLGYIFSINTVHCILAQFHCRPNKLPPYFSVSSIPTSKAVSLVYSLPKGVSMLSGHIQRGSAHMGRGRADNSVRRCIILDTGHLSPSGLSSLDHTSRKPSRALGIMPAHSFSQPHSFITSVWVDVSQFNLSS